MEIKLQQIKNFDRNRIREKWLLDPLIKKFISYFPDASLKNEKEKPSFSQNYEILYEDKLVGDLKVFGNKKDLKNKTAQFLIVLGESRGKGVGTMVVKLLLQKLKKMFNTVYCNVNRYNTASIKMLQKNGFLIKNLKGSEVIFYKTLV